MNDSNSDLPHLSYPAQDMCVGGDSSISTELRHEVIYSTLSNNSVKRLIERDYELDAPVECSLYNRGVNDVYLLSTPRKRFALRISRVHWRSRDAIGEELSAVRDLHRRGVDVALPVPRRDGNFITELLVPEGRRSAVAFQWANGIELKYSNPEHCLRYGRLIAKMHAAADRLLPCQTRERLDSQCLLTKPLSLIRPRLANLPGHIPRLNALVARIESHLNSAKATSLDWGFCHGDACSNNARIEGNRVVLFDFDICGLGWRPFDLACYRLETRRHALEKLAWPSFLKGYLEIRPQMEASLEFVGVFMILRYLWMVALWITLSSEGVMLSLAEDFFEGVIPYCEALESDTKIE